MQMALLLLGMLAAVWPQTPPVRTLRVLVEDGRSAPVPNVQVSLHRGTGPTTQPTGDLKTTDRDGVAEYADIGVGAYQIYVLHEGVRYPATASINAVLVNVRVRVGGFISGRIRTADGKPATNLRVEAGRAEVLNGRTAIRSWTRTDTDDDGLYRVPVTALGEYYIRAGSAPENRNLTDTFYSGTIDITAARTVAVRDWVPHTGLDFELQNPKTFKISGRVLTPAGAPYALPQPIIEFNIGRLNPPVQGLAVRLGMPGVEEFVLESVPSGQWEVTAAIYRPDRALPPGVIVVVEPGFDPLTILPGEPVFAFATARVRVVVQDRDVEGLVLTVNPPDIQGRVIGFPEGVQARSIQLLPKGYIPPGNLVARPDGEFSLTGVPPGRYALRAELPAGYYVDSIRVDAALVDENDGGFDLNNGDKAEIEITVRQGTGTIDGTLRAFDRSSEVEVSTSSLVVLAPAPPRENNTALYKTTTIAAVAGRFTFTEVPPGEYRVFAWARPRDSSPETLARYATFSTPVTVREGSISRVDAYLIPDE